MHIREGLDTDKATVQLKLKIDRIVAGMLVDCFGSLVLRSRIPLTKYCQRSIDAQSPHPPRLRQRWLRFLVLRIHPDKLSGNHLLVPPVLTYLERNGAERLVTRLLSHHAIGRLSRHWLVCLLCLSGPRLTFGKCC